MRKLPHHQRTIAGNRDTVVQRSRSTPHRQQHILEADFDGDTFVELVSCSIKLAVTKFIVDVVIK